MNVRCTRCRAVFSLEDVLYGGDEFKPLPPSIQVECGRCDYIFEAPVPGRAAKPSNPNLKPVRNAELDAARAQGNADLAKILKPRRPVEASGAAEHHQRAPLPGVAAGDHAAGGFERAERQRKGRVRVGLIAGGVAALVVLLALVAPALKRKLSGGLPAQAKAKVEVARAKLLLDDVGSLEHAVKLFREAARLAPGEAQPEADLAYATVLLSETHRDLADRLEAAGRARTDQVNKLQAEALQGWEPKAAALVEEVARIADDRKPHLVESEKLLGQARSAARAAADEDPEHPAVLRALALYFAATEPEKGREYLEKAESKGRGDPLSLYVRAAAALSGVRSRDNQDRALSALAEVQQAEPAMLRARVDSAAIAIERHQYGPARDALQRVLAANPSHERARLLVAALPTGLPND